MTPLTSGCGGPQRAAPVESDLARKTLKQALDSWKQGTKAETLQSGSPSIVVTDFDWRRGRKLKDYEVLGSGEALDANLHCPVKLTLLDDAGQPVEKTVTYIVGTDPVLTIARQVSF
jgi:hypothetical protein